jgi:hypothetical protein
MATEKRSIQGAPQRSSKSSSPGGIARAKKLSPDERKEIAVEAARARWGKSRSIEPTGNASLEPAAEDNWEGEVIQDGAALPEARHKGVLRLLELEIPCYVLSDGRRVIGRTSATEMLTGIKGGGALEKYISVAPLRPFIDLDRVLSHMISFRLPEVEGLERNVRGLSADDLIEVCQGFVSALDAHSRPSSDTRLTSRQIEMALKAGMFLSACAKVGLDALIDEATGYQYERAERALQVKLKAYLEDEMRPWEKTFPDELWREFGRLTSWHGTVTQRPKYWGKLVMELIYEYLDEDVAKWLKENAPKPRGGQNYHQWLTDQYGLKKLIEHIWMVVGMAKACNSMIELRDKMAELFGKQPVQYRMYLPFPE